MNLTKTEIANLVDIICEKEDIEPCFVKALVFYESGWNMHFVEQNGSMGLLGIDEEKERYIKKYLLSHFDKYNIESHLLGGIRYLKYLRNEFDGNMFYTVVAWKWGVENTKKWMQNKLEMPDSVKAYIKLILADIDIACKEG